MANMLIAIKEKDQVILNTKKQSKCAFGISGVSTSVILLARMVYLRKLKLCGIGLTLKLLKVCLVS
jgi:hypothetical protein